MGRHGENIRKRKDGRWEGRYLVYDRERDKKVYRSVYARSYDAVHEKLKNKKNQTQNLCNEHIRNQCKISPNDVNLDAIVQEWLTEIMEKKKRSTYIKYQLIYQKHIKKIFQDAVLSELTNTEVRERISEQYSDSVYKSIYCILNQILKFASERYNIMMPYLKKSVSDGKNLPVKALAKSEQKKLIDVLYKEMDCFKMAVLMCLFTGLRLGELCALKWMDIDFENKLLIVNRTVQRLYVEGYRTKTVLTETTPKSACSKREIPLSDQALTLFVKFQNNKEYVFGGEKPLEPKSLQNHFKKILKEAEISDKNFHILRHTFSTNCIEGGTDVKSLSEMLGHSNVQITLNRYVHPSMETKRQYINNLSKIYYSVY
ncbi:transposase from transposon Tn916 [Lachnospiraceae bacterium]|nr:transposase from transposon Tn916 [Lachnospiraceae bacterium]